ncbi:cupin domain-containing protein [Flavobacterium sp.]|uniref:cupin domain-containing protein n=1 Tax=Flavobacterium sp. TaxID=239 RepID=UPI00286A2217|nr:cupin domain-containing protein [Flavobacterium sp.]
MKPKKTNQENDSKLPKSQAHIILEIVEYVPDSIVCKTIIKNKNGKLSVTSFDEGEKFCEKLSEYETYVQVIDGNAAVTIDNKDLILHLGESIIIPVNTLHCFKANEQFKMITTIIKQSA